MKEAQKMKLTNVWLEYNYVLVCVAFTARTNVSWMFRNRWNICLNYGEKIRFRVTHIFHEGTECVDKLTNLGFIHRESFRWYNRLSSSLFLEFLPIYGFWSSPLIYFLYFFSFYFFHVKKWFLLLEVSTYLRCQVA